MYHTLFIHSPSEGHLDCFYFLMIMSKRYNKFMYAGFCVDSFLAHLGKYPWSMIASFLSNDPAVYSAQRSWILRSLIITFSNQITELLVSGFFVSALVDSSDHAMIEICASFFFQV